MIPVSQPSILMPGQDPVSNHVEGMHLLATCRSRLDGWIDWYGSIVNVEVDR